MTIKQGRPFSSRTVDSTGTRSAEAGTTSAPEFPSARYFQIHFEYLEQLLGDIRLHLDALRQQVADFQQSSGSVGNEAYQCSMPERPAVHQAAEEPATEYYAPPAPAGPALSLQEVGKRQKTRRKTSSAVGPVFGTVSGE